jgi:hypothetical protein
MCTTRVLVFGLWSVHRPDVRQAQNNRSSSYTCTRVLLRVGPSNIKTSRIACVREKSRKNRDSRFCVLYRLLSAQSDWSTDYCGNCNFVKLQPITSCTKPSNFSRSKFDVAPKLNVSFEKVFVIVNTDLNRVRP